MDQTVFETVYRGKQSLLQPINERAENPHHVQTVAQAVVAQ